MNRPWSRARAEDNRNAAERAEDDREATLMLGLILLSLGLALWWVPAALIVPGAILTAVSVLARPSPEAPA